MLEIVLMCLKDIISKASNPMAQGQLDGSLTCHSTLSAQSSYKMQPMAQMSEGQA